MKKVILILCLLLVRFTAFSQAVTQTIRGTIIDKESKAPLPFVSVVLLNATPTTGTNADDLGTFRLQNVPIGRHTLQIFYIGYKPLLVSDIQLNAAKEVVLTIEMAENVDTLAAVTIKSGNAKDKTVNDMIGISGRTFSLAEANRYAGSQNDPARMARNFAGVSGASDQRNDIIIRGNSPQGLLWKIEGIQVPNPNHFSAQGSTGGPISIINYKLLSNSDFITGAFPAEYGNATSGVFDINIRNGNNQKAERTLQIGALGLEAIAEGPLSKTGNASYIMAYRYSTLSLLSKANVKIGFASIPSYQDVSFKFNVLTKTAGSFTLFGIGGTSNTAFYDSKRDSTQFSPANRGENVYFGSKTGIIGLRHTYFFNNSTYLKTTIAATYEGNNNQRDTIKNDKTVKSTGGFGYNTKRIIVSSFVNKKINVQHTVQIGVNYEHIDYTSKDSLLFYNKTNGAPFWAYTNDFNGQTVLFQGYAQWRYKISNKLNLNTGLHAQYFDLNRQTVLEPRLALNYAVADNQTLSIGYGLHHQVQPYGMYFFKDRDAVNKNLETNRHLKFTQSNQVVMGYDVSINKDLRFKTEIYYQYLSNVPVENNSSSYSVMNYGATFLNTYRANLVNGGTGQNYGVEFTLEKFFSQNYYFLMTTSLFQSTYKASDGIERNTAFNGNFVVNALGGFERPLKHNWALLFDAKFTVAGGQRYSSLDLTASKLKQEAVYNDKEAFSLRNRVYFKPDVKVTLQKSFRNKMTLEWALDIQNVVNYKNVFLNWYDKNTQTEHQVYQNGRFPTVQLKLEF